jgi:hypothetical protein
MLPNQHFCEALPYLRRAKALILLVGATIPTLGPAESEAPGTP